MNMKWIFNMQESLLIRWSKSTLFIASNKHSQNARDNINDSNENIKKMNWLEILWNIRTANEYSKAKTVQWPFLLFSNSHAYPSIFTTKVENHLISHLFAGINDFYCVGMRNQCWNVFRMRKKLLVWNKKMVRLYASALKLDKRKRAIRWK